MDDDEDTLIRDAEFFLALRKKGRGSSPNVEECIKKGADVNIRFANNGFNTPLHIAVIKGDIETVNILIKHGARTDVVNAAGKTVLELAKILPDRSEFSELILKAEKAIVADGITNQEQLTIENANCAYKKRSGTANVRGQLYETKLLTMIFLRTLRNELITEFYMGTNLDEVGDMDDVCLRFKTERDDYAIFLQAKHKHDIVKGVFKSIDLWLPTSDFSLHKCYTSYRRTRDQFSVDSTDYFFRGNYDDINCYYVMYTTIKADIKDLRKRKPVGDDMVYKLIGTGKRNHVFQFTSEDENLSILLNALLKERIRTMGKTLMEFIKDKKYDMMLVDNDIRNFHVVLAEKVIKVSEINADGCRTGSFREEFFTSNEEMLILLRETLYAEVEQKNEQTLEEMEVSLQIILAEPTAKEISELIGYILVYDKNGKCLKLINEGIELSAKYQSKLKSLKVPESTVNDAFAIANRRKLEETNGFSLPKGFGNVDMTIIENKRASRTTYLAGIISELIKKSADVDGNVIIRRGIFSQVKKQDDAVLDINGGIAGAIGNLLLSDGENKYKFNLDSDSLGINARELQEKLLKEHQDLHKYRLFIDIDTFPRLSWHGTEKDKQFAKDFFDKLYFYTVQEKEDKFEGILTDELKANECSGGFNKSESQIKANALYLKIHNQIQIWWMKEGTVEYLRRDMNDFNKIFRDLKNKGLLTFLNFIYLNGVQNIGLEFSLDAVEILSVCKSESSSAAMIVVLTDVLMLTCHKLVQYLGGAEDYTFIDIDYVCRVSPHTIDMIINELNENDIPNVVIICEDITKYNINDLVCSCRAKKIILVTSDYVHPEACESVRDEKINLTDLTDSSQTRVLETKFVYQGIEVSFADVFDEGTKKLIDPKILRKIINKEQIVVGQPLEESTYDEIKHYFVPRTMKYNGNVYDTGEYLRDYTDMTITTYDEYRDYIDTFCPLTLLEHREVFQNRYETEALDVVLVLDNSGSGKSTLLTNLSLETKINYPKIWIQRINLIDHTIKFKEWQDKEIEVNNEVALKFLCNIGITKTNKKGNVWTYNNMDFETINDEVKVIGSLEDDPMVSFELRILLHCFKEGNIIFLFDGFAEIYPMYSNEVTDLIRCLSSRKSSCDALMEIGDTLPRSCSWITSRSYNDLSALLEDKFGKSYSLQPFTYTDVSVFLDKYMKHNFSLNSLSMDQLKIIDAFFEYMKKFTANVSNMENGLNLINLSLHSIYFAALRYFKSELKRTYLSRELLKYVRNWDRQVSDDFFQDYRKLNDAFTLSGVPLHVYLAVNYFHDQIRNTILINEESAKQLWDLDANVFAFYEGFLETKLKNWLVEKNGLDISKTAVGIIFTNQRIEFRNKHKKLAFYAIFHEQLRSESFLDDIKKILKDMERGEEHTGLVDRIINGIPKFVHYTFAEYFTVEYILDYLKSDDFEKQKYIIDFILVFILSSSISGVLSILDLKLKFDSDLIKSVSCTKVYKFVFDCLVEQNKMFQPTEYIDEMYSIFSESYTPHLDKVLQLGLPNLTDFLIKAVMDSVNEKNLKDFINLMDNGFFIDKLFQHKYYDYALDLIECVRKINPKKIAAIDTNSRYNEYP